jgi:hypothetical protein
MSTATIDSISGTYERAFQSWKYACLMANPSGQHYSVGGTMIVAEGPVFLQQAEKMLRNHLSGSSRYDGLTIEDLVLRPLI